MNRILVPRVDRELPPAGRGVRELVAAFVLRMSRVTFHPAKADLVRLEERELPTRSGCNFSQTTAVRAKL